MGNMLCYALDNREFKSPYAPDDTQDNILVPSYSNACK